MVAYLAAKLGLTKYLYGFAADCGKNAGNGAAGGDSGAGIRLAVVGRGYGGCSVVATVACGYGGFGSGFGVRCTPEWGHKRA